MVAKTSQEINEQKAQQLKLLSELKEFEQQQERAIKDLVREKSDLVLEKAKEEARRLAALARAPTFPDLSPRDPNVSAVAGQNYADSAAIPGNLPLLSSQASASSTRVAPLVAPLADLPGQSAGSHTSGAEAAVAGAVIAETVSL